MTEVDQSTRDMVYVSGAAHELFRRLSEGSEPESTPLRTMKDVFMWSVVLGKRADQRTPLDGRRVGVFRWSQFSSQVDVPILRAVAVTETERAVTLGNQNEVLRISEEYANAGIHELAAHLEDSSGTPLAGLMHLLHISFGTTSADEVD